MKLSSRRYGLFAVGIGVLFLIAAVTVVRRRTLSFGEFHSIRITDRYGRELRTVLSARQATSIWVPLDQIAPHLISAQIAAEDKRFYYHPGVDPIALARAARQNISRGRVVSGASTITQQLIRIVGQYPRSLLYKGWEAVHATLLELGTSKREILENYLNRVPYGNQCYGIGAASQLYFNKPPAQLSLAESAFIAGLAQSPSKYNPYRNPATAQRRQRYVLGRMLASGEISEKDFQQALKEPLQLSSKKGIFLAPHFCDMVIASLPADLNLVPQEIRTSLDWELQQDLERMVASYVKQMSSEQLSNASLVVMDNRTREILAMIGSANYFNEENDGQVNGATAPRPPGSTWKPFTYALALERGRTVADVLPDVPLYAATSGGEFTPRNFDERYHGPTRFRTALACSYNIPAVRLLDEVGTEALLRRLRELGFSFLTRNAGHYGLGLTLGGAEASLVQLVRSYATLANSGQWKSEKFILDVDLTPGRLFSELRIFSPLVSYLITDVLADRDARRPAFGGFSSLSLPFPCAIKTGTSKNYRDGWTLGYTSDFTVGTWVGNFDGSPMKSISGASGASMLFKQAMIRVHHQSWPVNFAMPSRIQLASVCPYSGLRPSNACPSSMREKFIAGTEPNATCAVHQLVPIDTRTNLLASSDCDPGFVRQEVFEVYDSIYQKWAVENRIPAPPVQLSPLCSQENQSTAVAVLSEPPAAVTEPEITFPGDDDVFVIDPVLRPEYQSIRLSANLPAGVSEIQWLVNGILFQAQPINGEIRWPLQAGNHEFKLRAKVGTIWRESRQIMINVI